MIANVDTFTECLRYAIVAFMAFIFLLVVGALVGTAFIKAWHGWQLKERKRVWDWEIDGGPVETEDMYPRTHVSVPDQVPQEWNEAWW